MKAATATRTRSRSGSGEGRAALLTAARELLSEHGGSRFSLASVAKRAGMNIALISYYFGGKEQMLLEILNEDEEVVFRPLAQLSAADLPAFKKLERYLSGVVELYARRPYLNILTHDLLRRSDDDTARRIAARVVTPVIDFHRALLAQGKAEGVFRDVDPFAFYLNVMGGVDMLFAARATIEHGFGYRMNDADLRKRFVRETLAIVTHGVATSPPPKTPES